MYKRFLLCLLLVLALCLCGCQKELPAEQMEALYGEWVIDGETIDGLPRFLTLSADGQISCDGLEAAAWAAYMPKADTDYAQAEILSNEKMVYSVTISTLYNNNYENLSARVEDKSGNFCGYYAKTVDIADTAFAQMFLCEWFPAGNNGNEMRLQFNADGSCLVDNMPLRWYVNPFYYFGENEMGFVIHDGVNEVYNGSIFFERGNLPQMDLRTAGHMQDHIDSYYNNKLIQISAKDGSWHAFQTANPITDYLYWGFNYLSFDGDDQRWELETATEDSITAHIPSSDAPEYKFYAFWNGEYPEVTLEIVATGETVHYYNYSAEHDPSNPEALYYKALYLIDCYLEGSTYHEDDNSYSKSDLLEYAYSLLSQIPEHRDAQAYLDRFTIVEHHLIGVTENRTDALDNVRTEEPYEHTFDKEGRLTIFRDDETAALFGLTADGYPVHCYSAHVTYDEQGAISDIIVNSHDNVYAKCAPEYDESGKLTALHIKETDREYSSLFSYDEKGNCTQIQMDNGSYTWEYDEEGRITRSVLSRKNYSVATVYTYENGAMTQKVETHTNRSSSWEVTYIFTNDAQGNPLTATVTSTYPEIILL